MRALFSAVVALSLSLAACSSAPARAPVDASALAIAETNARLRGTWVLVGYDPAIPPEPIMASLLAAQRERMTARFDGQRVQAEGVGFRVDRHYRVTEVVGPRFKMTIWDDQGIGTDTEGQLEPDGTLQFATLTPPWRGRGMLRRVGP
jgi:hypothetical protein